VNAGRGYCDPTVTLSDDALDLDAPALPADHPEVVEEAQAERHPFNWWPVRIALVVVYLVAFIWYLVERGYPAGRVIAFIWISLLVLVLNVGRPIRTWLQFIIDWGLLFAVLFAYDYSRAVGAHGWKPFFHARPVHVNGPRDADRFLFFGHDAVVWLQRYWDPNRTRWYDVAATLIYATHFLLPLGVGIGLWVRNRERWVRYMRRFIVLLAGGVAIYILYPAAPPWMAASPYYPYRAIDGLSRHSSAGWYWLHLSVMGDILNRGQEIANPVAAMPSLHAAFALLVVAFFMPGKKWWVKGLLLLFPLSMALSLMYTGEHYAIDAIIGWMLCGVVLLGCSWWERRHPRTITPAIAAADAAANPDAHLDPATSRTGPTPAPLPTDVSASP